MTSRVLKWSGITALGLVAVALIAYLASVMFAGALAWRAHSQISSTEEKRKELAALLESPLQVTAPPGWQAVKDFEGPQVALWATRADGASLRVGLYETPGGAEAAAEREESAHLADGSRCRHDQARPIGTGLASSYSCEVVPGAVAAGSYLWIPVAWDDRSALVEFEGLADRELVADLAEMIRGMRWVAPPTRG